MTYACLYLSPTAYIASNGVDTYVLELSRKNCSKVVASTWRFRNAVREADVAIPLAKVPLIVRRAAYQQFGFAVRFRSLTHQNGGIDDERNRTSCSRI